MPNPNTSYAADDCGYNYDHDTSAAEPGDVTVDCGTCGANVEVAV